jgi:RNA polymerase sigma factor (sigma-70 family)
MVGVTMNREDGTRDLIRLAKGGDRSAFDELAREWRGPLESMIRSRLGPQLRQVMDVEDVLQEMYLKAYRSLKGFEPRGERSFISWLKTIAEHVILPRARKLHQEALLCFDRDLASEEPSPSRAQRQSERFDRLQEALNALSKDHREVIVLARLKGLSTTEIAKRMKRTPNAVSLLLLRALRKLKETFGETESFHLPPHRLKEDEEEGKDA